MVFSFAPGTVIDDRYKVLAHLGEGGMGSVFKVREHALDRTLALKILHSSSLGDPDTQKRFIREGKILAGLKHPNILTFYRLGTTADFVYIATELIEGEGLDSLIAKEGKLSPDRVVEIAIQVCKAMSYAHSHNVVHRDLKPANIMLVSKPPYMVKIVDFGLAKLFAENSQGQHLTSTGTLLGSLHYMSPEQCAGKRADARSDIYSLGCLLYEALTGAPPLVADNPVGQMYLHINVPPAPLPVQLRDSLPAGLHDVLLKSMAKEPAERYESMNEFEKDLLRVQSGAGRQVSAAIAERKNSHDANPPRSPRRVALVAICGVIVLALVALLVAGSRQPGDEGKTKTSRVTSQLTAVSTHGLIAKGNALARAKNFEGARQFYLKALPRTQYEAPKERVKLLAAISFTYENEGNFDQAEKYRRECLLEAKRRLHADCKEIGDESFALARICRVQKKYAEAEELSKTAIRIAELGSGKQTRELPKRLESLAEIYAANNKLDLAEQQLQKAVASLEECSEFEAALAERIYQSLAVVLLKQKKLKDAESAIRKAIAVAERCGEVDVATSSLYATLASTLYQDERYREAELAAEKAVELRRESGATLELAKIKLVLAQTNMQMGKRSRVSEIGREIYSILNAARVKGGGSVTDCVANLILLLGANDDLLFAKQVYENESQNAASGDRQKFEVKLAPEVQLLAQKLVQRQLYDDAEPLCRKALYVNERSPVHFVPLYQSYLCLGACLSHQFRYEEAEPYFKRALAELEKSPASKAEDKLARLCEITDCLSHQYSQEKLDEAIIYARRTLALAEKLYGKHSSRLVPYLCYLANILCARERLSEAEAVARRQLAIEKKLHGENSAQYSDALCVVALILLHKRLPEQACKLNEEAVQIIERQHGERSFRVSSCLVDLALCLAVREEYARAVLLLKRAMSLEPAAPSPADGDTAYIPSSHLVQRIHSESALGQIYLLQGNQRAADESFQRVIKMAKEKRLRSFNLRLEDSFGRLCKMLQLYDRPMQAKALEDKRREVCAQAKS